MEPSQVVDWSSGDIAFIAEGEFSGTHARVWEIDIAQNKAVVSLHVFREKEKFEIDLRFLRKPPPPMWRILKAIVFAVVCVASGPVIFVALLIVADACFGLGQPPFLSSDVIAHTISWPLYVAVALAVYVAFRVLTDPHSTA